MIRLAGWLVIGVIGVGCADAHREVVIREVWPTGAPKHTMEQVHKDTVFERFFYENGALDREGRFDAEGKKTGVWRAHYPDGKPWSEHHYERGIQVGPYRTWHPNGNINIRGQYSPKGESVGTWQFFSPDGTLIRELDGVELPSH
jgi:antitoxin component YwqK of YwqJK toxin-antitoxin module